MTDVTPIVLLCCVCLLLGLGLFVLALSVPFLYWRVFRGDGRLDDLDRRLTKRLDDISARLSDQDRKLEVMDEAVGGLLEVAGVPKHVQAGFAGPSSTVDVNGPPRRMS